MTFQVADVTKPLCSVGQVCDAGGGPLGSAVVFTRSAGFILNLDSKVKTEFSRENKMYMLHTWIEDAPEAPKKGF